MHPSPDHPVHVQILLWEGVELLDFAGPAEVFSAAGFSVEAVAVAEGPLTSQGFLTVTPSRSLGEAAAPDILVVPGGASERASHDPEIRARLQALAPVVPILFSVCTGALVLARAGLLDGLEATTWHGALDELRGCSPSIRVREGVRWVDNGSVVTAAGVSAGIDAALHLVRRLRGDAARSQVARYMEYVS
jgi:transcriptional regulator GlxA family with amidase domain